jgi:twitching motility protein PilT
MEVPSIFLNRILSETAKRHASSLHLTVGSAPTFRVDDELSPMAGEGIITAELLTKIINSFLSPEEAAKLAMDKELILVKTFGGSFRFRVNIFFQKKLPSLSFFYIPDSIKNLSDFRFPPALTDILKASAGLLIIAGPHGSGKTTTAASFIEEANKNSAMRIFTLEDPIEYSFVSKKSIVEQRQIGSDVKSFVDGLSYCLEEDIDLVYVGEIRKDLEQAVSLVLELASGNCLVILEINASNSTRAIEKILNAAKAGMPDEAARYSLSDALLGVLVQRLLPKHGGGMSLALEILLANSAVKSLVKEGKIYQLESVIQTSRKEGMINMEKSLEELVRNGEVGQENV